MKQITEDYCSFEISKLLKEKGFDEPTIKSYYVVHVIEGVDEYMSFSHELSSCIRKYEYLCPTHQMVLKWLREVHNIHIDVFIGSDESYDADGVMVDEWHFWTYYITNTSGDMIYDAYNEVDVIEHQTHEEAVEAAILYVLKKNLID